VPPIGSRALLQAAGAALAVLALAAPAQAASVAVVPGEPAAGERVMARGLGFPPRARVVVRAASLTLAAARTDARGRFRLAFALPPGTTGRLRLSATASRTVVAGSLLVRRTPRPGTTLVLGSAALRVALHRGLGGDLRLTAGGLAPRSRVEVLLAGRRLAAGRSDRRGRFARRLSGTGARAAAAGTIVLRTGRRLVFVPVAPPAPRVSSAPIAALPPPSGQASPTPPGPYVDPGASRHPVLAAAGDVACAPGSAVTPTTCRHGDTASLLETLAPDAVAILGDVQYDRGTALEFQGSFAPTWGRLGDRLRPAPGNHEYLTPGAAGYFGYFGPAAGPDNRGYYSYDIGSWHVIALNSNCTIVSCAAGSEQERWLRADLAANPSRCVMAYWHHPRFSSGPHGDSTAVAPLWTALHEAGADVVLAGHDHLYERFAPQGPQGNADPNGIREWVVGTGGRRLYTFGPPKPNSEARDDTSFGVLALTLRPDGYDWRFHSVGPGSFGDTGSGACH
jgi:acid phosphatase type 7